MGTNEEYLDSLLKSMTGKGEMENTERDPSDVEDQYAQVGNALDASLVKEEALVKNPNKLRKELTGDSMSPVTSVSDADAINQYLDELEQIETEEADQERIRFKEMEKERLEEERLHEERLASQRIREEKELEQKRLEEEQRLEQQRLEEERQKALDAGVREALEKGEESFNDFFAPPNEDAHLEEKLTNSINELLDEKSDTLDKLSQQFDERTVVESLDDLFGVSFSDSDNGEMSSETTFEESGEETAEETAEEAPAADNVPTVEEAFAEENMNGEAPIEEVPIEETKLEELPSEEAQPEKAMPELSDDPNHVMTPEEIAALVAGTGVSDEAITEDTSAEGDVLEGILSGIDELEGIPTEEQIPSDLDTFPELLDGEQIEKIDETLSGEMTPEEIDAMLNGGGDVSDLPGQDESANLTLSDMSEDDVVSMLEKAGEVETGENELGENGLDEDLAQLLEGSDDELSEISDLLNYSEEDNLIDDEMLALLEGVNEGDFEDADGKDSASGEEKGSKGGRKKRSGKEKGDKKGFLQKILDFIFEEAEEDEVDIPEKNELGEISEENLQILESLEAEGKKGGKEKKAKEKKPKKEKPPKEKKPKKEKPPKEKKPKKEKPPKEIEKKSKKIPKAKIILVVLLTIAVIFSAYLMGIILPKQANLRQARKDYQAGNYLEAYIGFSGKELNSSDRLMKTRASIACRLTRKIDSYQNYHDLGMELEALNSLIQGAALYYDLAELAGQCDMENAAYQIYLQIDELLRTNYGIDGETAKWIDDIVDDTIYTINVKRVLAGQTDQLIEKITVEYNPDAPTLEGVAESVNPAKDDKPQEDVTVEGENVQESNPEGEAALKETQTKNENDSSEMFQEIKDFDVSGVNQNGEEVPVEISRPEVSTPPGDGRPVETPKPELKDEIVGE